MNMPITVEIADPEAADKDIDAVFSYFQHIEETFSVFKETSEISKINRGEISENDYSQEMKEVFEKSEQTRRETNGYFNIIINGRYNPSGLVKGWAIYNAGQLLKNRGFKNFYVDAGGDIQAYGRNSHNRLWSVGIKNPFQQEQIVKVIYLLPAGLGMATSGTYIRGQHIYNPHNSARPLTEIVSLTVIGSNIYEADRFATAAFAMERSGIEFLERLNGFEGYMIDKNGQATMTTEFEKYTIESRL